MFRPGGSVGFAHAIMFILRLSCCRRALPQAPTASRASSGTSQPHRHGSQGGVDVLPWEVQFRDLSILRRIGEGSFGHVSAGAAPQSG